MAGKVRELDEEEFIQNDVCFHDDLPQNINFAFSLSPCLSLDELSMNPSLRHAWCNSRLTPTYTQTHRCLSLQIHGSTHVGSLPSFSFPGNLSPCKKTNGYLFQCYPQMRKYPSSSPHDDFPSKESSRLEFSSCTPLSPFLRLSAFFSHCFSFTFAFTHPDAHIHSQAHGLSGYPVRRGLQILLTAVMLPGSLLCFASAYSSASRSRSHWRITTELRFCKPQVIQGKCLDWLQSFLEEMCHQD